MEIEQNSGDEGDEQIGYTVELDMPNINNFLNMYNNVNTFNSNLTSETTTTPMPMPFTSLNTSFYCPADNISQIYGNIEPLYVSEIKDMRNTIINILNERPDFNDEEYDLEKYENKEIDDLYEKIINVNEDFKKLQDNLYNAEKNLKKELDILNSNEIKLQNFISFLENISSIDFDEIKGLIEEINKLSIKLSNSESFLKAKKEYATERKNIQKYIYLLRKVNKMNVTNMCVVCMEKQVSHFINPCGHTFCSKCLETHFEINDITNIEDISNNKTCPVCRVHFNNIKPLYFL